MGRLTSVFADEIRILRKVTTGERVEGRTPSATTIATDWIGGRLFPTASRESNTDGRRAVVATADLFLPPDTGVWGSDELEIRSRGEVGRWRITALPEPLRGRRTTIAELVRVERLVEPEAESIG